MFKSSLRRVLYVNVRLIYVERLTDSTAVTFTVYHCAGWYSLSTYRNVSWLEHHHMSMIYDI